ncbi:MAG TPA: methyltransferase domain-containing protein [Beijerinckiaceae bacterium]
MPAPPLRSSGDLLADRRFAYAQGAFEAGDHAAAAELAVQVLELVPGFAPAHALLGRARAALGEAEAAVAALRAALEAEPDDALGVRIDLARLGALDPGEAIAPGYVRALFDDYAPRFDRHLVRNLDYRGPELIAAAMRRACSLRGRPFRFARVLDLGCGTGLMGQALAGRFETIEGVDLSPKMLARARKTRLYERLYEGDLVGFLAAREEGCADLVVAADVFVYLASLDAAFRAARRALARDGLFAFSVQAHDGDGFGDGFGDDVRLGEDARYAHGEPYLRRLAAETALTVVLLERASTRQERGEAVPGFVAVLER